jgi:hypothetical protein
VFRMNLPINSDCFSKRPLPAGIYL